MALGTSDLNLALALWNPDLLLTARTTENTVVLTLLHHILLFAKQPPDS